LLGLVLRGDLRLVETGRRLRLVGLRRLVELRPDLPALYEAHLDRGVPFVPEGEGVGAIEQIEIGTRDTADVALDVLDLLPARPRSQRRDIVGHSFDRPIVAIAEGWDLAFRLADDDVAVHQARFEKLLPNLPKHLQTREVIFYQIFVAAFQFFERLHRIQCDKHIGQNQDQDRN